MVIWRFQSSQFPLVNSDGARRTGGRWNQQGTAVIYASETVVLAAMEVIVHHGGIPEDYVGIRIEIPEDVEVGNVEVPDGWPDVVPEDVTAEQGSTWVRLNRQAVLRVPSATMSVSGYNYVLNPAHPDFARISFGFAAIRFDARLRPKEQ